MTDLFASGEWRRKWQRTRWVSVSIFLAVFIWISVVFRTLVPVVTSLSTFEAALYRTLVLINVCTLIRTPLVIGIIEGVRLRAQLVISVYKVSNVRGDRNSSGLLESGRRILPEGPNHDGEAGYLRELFCHLNERC